MDVEYFRKLGYSRGSLDFMQDNAYHGAENDILRQFKDIYANAYEQGYNDARQVDSF